MVCRSPNGDIGKNCSFYIDQIGQLFLIGVAVHPNTKFSLIPLTSNFTAPLRPVGIIIALCFGVDTTRDVCWPQGS